MFKTYKSQCSSHKKYAFNAMVIHLIAMTSVTRDRISASFRKSIRKNLKSNLSILFKVIDFIEPIRNGVHL